MNSTAKLHHSALYGAALLACLSAVPGCARNGSHPSDAYAGPRTKDFNRNWRFTNIQQDGAEAVSFDDDDWQIVRLPHDWAISGPYDPEGDPHTGKLPWKGEAWYRKEFTLPAADAGRRVYLDFDGVMAMPTVYVNGREAGGWDYGYM